MTAGAAGVRVPAPGARGAAARPVRVELLLAGGHREALDLESDSPLLRGLLDALAARLGRPPARVVLFQIPRDGGRAALTFTSDQLVGLRTEPAVLAGSEDVLVPPEALAVIPARYVRYEGVLGPAAKARLLEGAIARAAELVPSRVIGGPADHRRSRLIERPGELAEGIVGRVRGLLPELCARLAVPPFPVGRIEAQLTVHTHGDYFHLHTDKGTGETAARRISYVYYFHREPRPFTGGELVLFDARPTGGLPEPVGPPVVVEPEDDTLVVFPSECLHAVRPVHAESGRLEDGRFTVNGCVRRAEEDGAA